MKITNILLVAILLTTASCKDWLNMVPKNERVVSNIEDVKAELLTYWSSSTYASLPVEVMETRPLSKDKRWRVVEIIEKAK